MFVKHHGEIAKNVHGGLAQRQVEVKNIKQYAKESCIWCGIKLFEEYTKCVPSTGRVQGKVPSRLPGVAFWKSTYWHKYPVEISKDDELGS